MQNGLGIILEWNMGILFYLTVANNKKMEVYFKMMINNIIIIIEVNSLMIVFDLSIWKQIVALNLKIA